MEKHNGVKVLVLDDDQRLRDLLSRYLQKEGFVIKAVENAVQMDRLLAREHFSALVLDLMLPGEDGLSICRRLRAENNPLPIIMLTAKGEDIDKILGLEMGADDYLSKPFNPRELLARLHSLLRRAQAPVKGAPDIQERVMIFGEYELHTGTRELWKQGKKLELTSGEFALLKIFTEHNKKPLSRDALMSLLHGRDYNAYDRSIDVQVSRLRRLIEKNPVKPDFIQTVWGVGYVFIAKPETAGKSGV